MYCKNGVLFSLIKLRIISLNFKEWHFDKQISPSTSFKFSKKNASRNCADIKQNCVGLSFLSIYLRSSCWCSLHILHHILVRLSNLICFPKSIQSEIKYIQQIKTNQVRIIEKCTVNIFKRPSIYIYLLFGLSSMKNVTLDYHLQEYL